MDFERLKTEWQNQKFEGYLFDTPLDVITKDVRKKARKRACKYLLANFIEIAAAVLIAAICVMAVYREHSLPVRAASLILMMINFFEVFWLLKWRITEYNRNFHLPARRFLITERDTMEKKLRQIRWQLPWSGITGLMVLAFLALSISMHWTTGERYLNFLIGFTVGFLIYYFTELRKMKSDLPVVLAMIKRDIQQFEEAGISSDEAAE
jgi:hypothetical protein